MSSFMAKVSIAVSGGLLLLMALPISFAAVQWLEFRYHPVMLAFRITETAHPPGGQVIAGDMFKARNCETLQLVAYSAAGDLLSVSFLGDPPNTKIKSRSAGQQPFKGILIEPDAPLGRLIVRHSCHFMWDSVTDLLTLPGTLPRPTTP
jgi:hypothetical protein